MLMDSFLSTFAQMPIMFDQTGQPLPASSSDNIMSSHGAVPSQPQPMHVQGLSLQQQQQLAGPGPLPRTANSSAPQTPMMEVEPTSATSMGRAPSPQSSQGASQNDRPLNVTDALSYLDAVKSRFHDRTDVYNRFLDIMKDFKTQVLVSDIPPLNAYVFNSFSLSSKTESIRPVSLSVSPNYSMHTLTLFMVLIRSFPLDIALKLAARVPLLCAPHREPVLFLVGHPRRYLHKCLDLVLSLPIQLLLAGIR